MQDGDGPDGVEVIGLTICTCTYGRSPSGGFSLFPFAFPDPPPGVGELKQQVKYPRTVLYIQYLPVPRVLYSTGRMIQQVVKVSSPSSFTATPWSFPSDAAKPATSWVDSAGLVFLVLVCHHGSSFIEW